MRKIVISQAPSEVDNLGLNAEETARNMMFNVADMLHSLDQTGDLSHGVSVVRKDGLARKESRVEITLYDATHEEAMKIFRACKYWYKLTCAWYETSNYAGCILKYLDRVDRALGGKLTGAIVEEMAEIIDMELAYTNGWKVDDDTYRDDCRKAARKILAALATEPATAPLLPEPTRLVPDTTRRTAPHGDPLTR